MGGSGEDDGKFVGIVAPKFRALQRMNISVGISFIMDNISKGVISTYRPFSFSGKHH
jgi:hypothetical protein